MNPPLRSPLCSVVLLSLLVGCGTRAVQFQVYDEDDACWRSTTEDRPVRYWPQSNADTEFECVNADGDCVRFDGISDDPWLGDCEPCTTPEPGSPPC